MNNYLTYLKNIQGVENFERKVNYIKFNFSKYINTDNKKLSVLEVGPGLGEFVYFLNRNNISNIDIFDNEKEVIKYVKGKYHINNSINGDDISKDETSLGSYDVIFLLQVLEHLPKEKYVPTLKTLYKLLNQNGKMIITVPNGANPLNLSERYSDITHNNLFTENSLIQLCLMCDIRKEDVTVFPYKIPPSSVLNILRIFLQKVLHVFIKLQLVVNGGVNSRLLTPNIFIVITKI